jgi:hypothetical protein
MKYFFYFNKNFPKFNLKINLKSEYDELKCSINLKNYIFINYFNKYDSQNPDRNIPKDIISNILLNKGIFLLGLGYRLYNQMILCLNILYNLHDKENNCYFYRKLILGIHL